MKNVELVIDDRSSPANDFVSIDEIGRDVGGVLLLMTRRISFLAPDQAALDACRTLFLNGDGTANILHVV